MKRRHRVLVEIVAPPLLGATILWFFAVVNHGAQALRTARTLRMDEWANVWLVFVCGAYFFAGVPSLLYAAIMEWRFSCGLEPASWRAVTWSSVLGPSSGTAMVVILGTEREDWGLWPKWGILGLAVGFIVGCFVRSRARRAFR